MLRFLSEQRFSIPTSTAMEASVLTFSRSSGALPLPYPSLQNVCYVPIAGAAFNMLTSHRSKS
ncbi:hypothetical protein Golob_006842 [Gossypium lobatum]|uniref:Uncharacterized protein n=1 Tax=Gossypium lobatum TaxID=34289 RepID=A0A7J8NIC9_9ROSI|nr:hypothetical protein [Gossypium lobatum]